MKEYVSTLPISPEKRLDYLIKASWDIFFERVLNNKIIVNKESSMQLHFSVILHTLGELLCLSPDERFDIELESNYKKKNIDITCSLNGVKAAIELKCFRKKSNRATDLDMYAVLKDMQRLLSYDDFKIRKFYCLTDNKGYAYNNHKGHAACVSISDGHIYKKDIPIEPSWKDKWKIKSHNSDIIFTRDILLKWESKNDWHFLYVDLSK
jgi:hypothetical protein